MTSWDYITQSVPWITVGLLVGFFMARSTVAVEQIADAVQHEVESMSGNDEKTQKSRRTRFTTTHVLGIVLVLLGTFSAVQAMVQSNATNRLTECQLAYADGFADALDARSKAATEAQEAQDELWSTVASLSPTPESREVFRDALNEYLKKRAAAKKAQADHPFPEPPRDVCKEDG